MHTLSAVLKFDFSVSRVFVADLEMSGDSFGAVGTDAQQNLQSFWPRVMEEIRNLTVV